MGINERPTISHISEGRGELFHGRLTSKTAVSVELFSQRSEEAHNSNIALTN
jgi:hypothetical protein